MVYAVIIAGGGGKRLWPKSNKLSPKHLLSFSRGTSLLEETFKRLAQRFPKNRILIVTIKKNFRRIRRLLPALENRNFLIEPEAKNTAPAITLAAFKIEKESPGAIMAVFPSDHIIKDERSFFRILDTGISIAQETGMLGTIGIRPEYPAIGYGYIKIGGRWKVEGGRVNYFKVERFREKPSLDKAKVYTSSKKYFWNSGIFIWKVSSILEAIKKFNPRLYNSMEQIQNGKDIKKIYKKIENISIDYCVMERARNVFTVVGDFDWIDIGSWLSLDKLYKKDNLGNVVLADHRGIDTRDSIVVGESGHLIGTIGVKDLIIVHTKEATLVCNRDRAEEVKRLLI